MNALAEVVWTLADKGRPEVPDDFLRHRHLEQVPGIAFAYKRVAVGQTLAAGAERGKEVLAVFVLPHNFAGGRLDLANDGMASVCAVVEDQNIAAIQHGRLVLAIENSRTPAPDDLVEVGVDNADYVQVAQAEQQIAGLEAGVLPAQRRVRQGLDGVGVSPVHRAVGLVSAGVGLSHVRDRQRVARQFAKPLDMVSKGELVEDLLVPVELDDDVRSQAFGLGAGHKQPRDHRFVLGGQ